MSWTELQTAMWLLRDIYNQCSFKLNATQPHWPVLDSRNSIHRPQISQPEETMLCPALLRHLWEKLQVSLSLQGFAFSSPCCLNTGGWYRGLTKKDPQDILFNSSSFFESRQISFSSAAGHPVSVEGTRGGILQAQLFNHHCGHLNTQSLGEKTTKM